MYKVVHEDNKGHYWSCSYPYSKNAQAKLRYNIGEVTLPEIEGSKLFVFQELLYAKNFVSMLPLKIFLCEVVNPIAYNSIIPHTNDDLTKFWQNLSEKKGIWNLAPLGTILCDSVKLIKQVQQ